jgi:flagellar motor switch protein FliM
MSPNDPLAGQEILTQSEVERLLSQVQAEETSAPVVTAEGKKTRLKLEDIQPFDFRQPAFLTSSELRRIRLRHEEFIRSLAARLAIYLRLEVAIHMAKLHTILYNKFTETLANPTHLTLFKAEPLRGICLLDTPPRLGLTMVDRLLGGPAHSVNANRDLSEIEIALSDQIARIILGEWCNLWQKLQELRPVLVGHENNGRFLQTAPHDTVMLCLCMEVRLGDCIEQLQMAFPYYTVEPLVRQLSQSSDAERSSGAPPQAAIRWNPALDDLKTRLVAEWNGLQLTARQLGQLRPGDFVPLEGEHLSRVRVRVETLPKFHGRLGAVGGHRAIEILQINT